MNNFFEFVKKEIKLITFVCTFLGTIAGGVKAYHDIFSKMETQGHSFKMEQKVIKLDKKIEEVNNKLDEINKKLPVCPTK